MCNEPGSSSHKKWGRRCGRLPRPVSSNAKHFSRERAVSTLATFVHSRCVSASFMTGQTRSALILPVLCGFPRTRGRQAQEMSNTLWALATAGFAPRHVHAFDTTLVPASHRPTPETMEGDPFTMCFANVASEAMRRPHQFKDQVSRATSPKIPCPLSCRPTLLVVDAGAERRAMELFQGEIERRG